MSERDQRTRPAHFYPSEWAADVIHMQSVSRLSRPGGKRWIQSEDRNKGGKGEVGENDGFNSQAEQTAEEKQLCAAQKQI